MLRIGNQTWYTPRRVFMVKTRRVFLIMAMSFPAG